MFGGSAAAARRGYSMQESHTRRHGPSELQIKLLNLTSLMGLQLRDFLHMPEEEQKKQTPDFVMKFIGLKVLLQLYCALVRNKCGL